MDKQLMYFVLRIVRKFNLQTGIFFAGRALVAAASQLDVGVEQQRY